PPSGEKSAGITTIPRRSPGGLGPERQRTYVLNPPPPDPPSGGGGFKTLSGGESVTIPPPPVVGMARGWSPWPQSLVISMIGLVRVADQAVHRLVMPTAMNAVATRPPMPSNG